MSYEDSNDMDDFLAELQDVKPLKQTTIDYVPQQQDLLAKQLKRQQIEEALLDANNPLTTSCVNFVKPDDHLSYKKSGVQEGVFKNLRLGKYKIEQVINLQQMKFEQARGLFYRKLCQAHQMGQRTLLVKHGRGQHSQPQPATLKSFVNLWLQQMPQVIAYHTALSHHGGAGATYVLLRKNENDKAANREWHRKK